MQVVHQKNEKISTLNKQLETQLDEWTTTQINNGDETRGNKHQRKIPGKQQICYYCENMENVNM